MVSHGPIKRNPEDFDPYSVLHTGVWIETIEQDD